MDVEGLRRHFPELSETVYGKPLVYLDNAATSQRPESVVAKWTEMSVKFNSNLHRAVHHLADVATGEYESTRDAVRSFINAESADEIVFTSGATMALNLVAYSFGEKFIEKGDEIFVTESEHHSNIVPWQILCGRKKTVLKVVPVDEAGYLDLDFIRENISGRTKLLCVAQISNVLGLSNPIKEIVNICHSNNCKVLTDGSQGIVHSVVDVRDLGTDFYVFSGHKLYAAPGTGVLYAKKEILAQMPPFLAGGEMIDTVKWSGTTYADVPHRFEAGTQNIAGVPTLKPAIEEALLMRDPVIQKQNAEVRDYVYSALMHNPDIRLYGVPRRIEEKIPLFSFSVNGVHHEDLALLLDRMGIAVRSGQMCAEPLMDRYGVTGMLRASFAPYNTLQEAEYFIQSLWKAIGMLK